MTTVNVNDAKLTASKGDETAGEILEIMGTRLKVMTRVKAPGREPRTFEASPEERKSDEVAEKT